MWEVVYTIGDAAHSHVFPHSVFQWRVAEYGLDPIDIHGLIETVLYEPYIESDPDHPHFLHNAPTIDTAKAHYRTLINAAKGTGGLLDRPRQRSDSSMIDRSKARGRIIADTATDPATPLQILKRHIVIDPDTVTAMRTTVTKTRNRRDSP